MHGHGNRGSNCGCLAENLHFRKSFLLLPDEIWWEERVREKTQGASCYPKGIFYLTNMVTQNSAESLSIMINKQPNQ